MDKYEKKIFKALRKEFTQDEALSILDKQYSLLQIENGKLRSEVDELKDWLSKDTRIIQIRSLEKQLKKYQEDVRIKEYRTTIDKLNKKIAEQDKVLNRMIAEKFSRTEK